VGLYSMSTLQTFLCEQDSRFVYTESTIYIVIHLPLKSSKSLLPRSCHFTEFHEELKHPMYTYTPQLQVEETDVTIVRC
jgi:hypothetical protein